MMILSFLYSISRASAGMISKGGYTGFTSSIHLSVRPSVCLSVRPCVRPSVDKTVSALYLPQYWSDPFHICTSYQATSEGVLRVRVIAKFQNLNFFQIFGICDFDFVFLWPGIWCESLVWVIMGRRGVSQNAGVLVVLVEDEFHQAAPLLCQMIISMNRLTYLYFFLRFWPMVKS